MKNKMMAVFGVKAMISGPRGNSTKLFTMVYVLFSAVASSIFLLFCFPGDLSFIFSYYMISSYIRRIVHPKMKIVILYSPSCCSTPMTLIFDFS